MKKILIIGMIVFMGMNLFAVEDEGYFLSFKQKGELIWLGQIQGDDGNWYNIRIVPGYVAPSKYAWESWGCMSDSFGEYFSNKKYMDLADESGDVYEWAFDKCINRFIIKGVPDSWSDYFGAAHDKVEKRIFGWPMAYPLATFQVFVDNLFRIPAGMIGCVLGSTAGTVIIPGYHMMDSSVKGIYYFIVPGTILPISGYTWNTIISPPLALTGQKPSESRIDGYWVTKISPAEFDAKNKPLGEGDIGAIAEWGNILSQKLGKYDEEMKKAQEECNRKAGEAYNEYNRKREQLNKNEAEEYRQIADLPENKELLSRLNQIGLSSYTIDQNYIKLKNALMSKGLTEAQVIKTYDLLRKYSRYESHNVAKKSRDKTDPVTESIEVIKNTDK